MEINSRMSSILYLILSASKGRISIESILEETKLSKRAFYYDLGKINTCLEDSGISAIQVEKGECLLKKEDIPAIEELLESQTGYLASSEERMVLEMVYIALDNNPMTLDIIRQKFDVSKNTIQSDLKILKRRLGRIGISLMYSHGEGYYFEGDELIIRNFISDELSTVRNRGVWMMIVRLLNSSASRMLQEEAEEADLYQMIVHEIQKYGFSISASFVEEFIHHTAILIMVAIIRNRIGGAPIQFDQMEYRTICYTEEFNQIKKMLQQLAMKHVVLPKEEEFYVAFLLLGMKRFTFQGKFSHDIIVVVDTFIKNLERIMGKPIERKQELREKIALHMAPMYYRLKLGFHCNNPLLEDIVQMYPLGFQMVKKAIVEADGEMEKLITDDEIAFLVMVVESHMMAVKMNEDLSEIRKILIVCGAGVSTSVFVRAQLQELIGEGYQFELSSISNLSAHNLPEYSLVVSTVRSSSLPDDTIYASAILNEKDMESIIHHLCDRPLMLKQTTINEIVSVFEDQLKSKERADDIRHSLFNYFYKRRD